MLPATLHESNVDFDEARTDVEIDADVLRRSSSRTIGVIADMSRRLIRKLHRTPWTEIMVELHAKTSDFVASGIPFIWRRISRHGVLEFNELMRLSSAGACADAREKGSRAWRYTRLHKATMAQHRPRRYRDRCLTLVLTAAGHRLSAVDERNLIARFLTYLVRFAAFQSQLMLGATPADAASSRTSTISVDLADRCSLRSRAQVLSPTVLGAWTTRSS